MKYASAAIAKLCVAGLAIAILWAPFANAAEHNPLNPNFYMERLKEIKGVDDGKLSKSEFMKYHEQHWGKMSGHHDMLVSEHRNPLSPHYGREDITKLDKNKDGVISAEEYMKFHEAHWEEWKAKGVVDSFGYLDRNNPLLPKYTR